MLGFVKRRGFLTFLGFLLLAVFIWYAGPYFAFADYYPLEPVNARILLFLAIVALWFASRVLKRFRSGRASDQLAAAVVRQAAAEPARPSAEALQLRERFEEAVSTLKTSRRSGHSLYDLPWYIIIGAPGSGKTTALLNSGLKFPLEQRVGKGALRGVGGTRNCDWWFTDEAVFLDTAGRYTTQDSDAESDSAGWSEFLSLLVKYRKRRPINGVILTISAQDLMTLGERGREAHVEAARRRLSELNEQLRIQLPVYVMVTKCDLVAGFTEYFEDLAQDGRAQVWGVTFPYEQTLSGEASQRFPAEFDQLMARLNARVFARVEEDRDVRRRTKIFAFPQQIAALRESLAHFVADVFSSTRLDRQILLRGVYMTSGTQEGTPVDRLLGAIGRRYGVAPDVVAPPTGRGKAYFVERLLKEVLIAESGLAGVNRRLEMQKAAMQLGSYAAMALLAVGGVILLSVSYGRNRAYIAETAGELASLEQAQPAGPADPLEALLPRLNAIRGVVDVANRHREDTPWSMRWGLYQGNSLGNAARDAYVRELDGTLLPRVAARIEERLGQYAPEPEKLFEYLKAYLMLGDPRRLDKQHLQFIADLEWHAADTAVPDAGATLAKHFQSLLEYADTLRPIGLNERLVAQARSTIRQASIPQIIYSRLKRTYQADEARAVRLDQAAGVGVEQVIRRRSGTSLAEPIPSFYVRPVFREVTTRDIGALVKQFAADDWVWGEDKALFALSNTLATEVTDLYERDYITTWDGVLNDLELVPFATLAQTADGLAILAGQTSPLKGILATVVEHTTLVEQPGAAPTGAAAAAKKAFGEKLSGLFKNVPDALKPKTSTPGALVTAHFQPVHRLMAGEPGNAPIDQILLRIGQMQHHLQTLSFDPASTPPDAASDPVLREILQSLQQESMGLPPSIQSIVGQVGRKAEVSVVSSASSELERRYRLQVLQPCRDVIAERYPFTYTSKRDLPIADFTRLFGYGGVFDRFFAENLQGLIDTSQTPWAWRPGSASGSREMLEKFESANRIRELFFRRGSQGPDLRFTVNLTQIDPNIPQFVLEIDGQYFSSRDPQRLVQAAWPGPAPGRAAARFETRAGGRTQDNFMGSWGLFRMFEQHAERKSDTHFVLSFEMDGQEARVLLDADRVNNPFARRDWQRFTCAVP
jgi:type VI secretion system protein ImpL